MVNIDDSVLLKRAIYQRDKKAVEVLHSRYYQSILRYIAGRVGYCVDAEDLAQNVFVELCKGNGRYDGRGNVEGYLFGIARNTIRGHYRQKSHSVKTVPIDSVNGIGPSYDVQQHRGPVTQISAQQLKKTIEDAVAQLPPKTRQAVRLRFIEGISSKEAAKRAGCSVDVFYRRVYEGLKALKKLKGMSGSGFRGPTGCYYP